MDLSAVVDALHADAAAQARRVTETARTAADAEVEHARAEGARLAETARQAGEREADVQLARERASSRRAARERVLAARRRVYDELERRVLERARRLSEDSRYASLVERLEGRVRARLGPGATLTREPDGAPGLVGELGTRRIDERAEAIAERALASLGPETETLWT